jgi:hydrogenase nickel incorporation protein HypA/HybF
MHELSLSTGILETVLRHADGRKVTGVQLTIGTMRQVVPESLTFYFEIVSRDTEAEGAELEMEIVPARLRCRSCGSEWEPEFADFRCSGCAAAEVEVLSGTEFEVESIDVEQTTEGKEDAECIARR